MAVGKDPLGARIRWLSGIIFVTALIFALPTMMLICFTMIPTLAAYVADPYKRNRYLSVCVGSMSLAATVPFLLQLWSEGNNLNQAMNTLANPMVWLTILCGAGIGWVLYGIFPQMVSFYVINMWQRRISNLEERQRELISDWGEDVKSNSFDEL